MAVGDELRKNYASDASEYNLGIQSRQVASENAKVLASALTNKKCDAKATAHRSTVSAADTGDISSATGAKDAENSICVECHCTFNDGTATAKIALAVFDEANDLIGITEIAEFGAHSSWRDGAAGEYVSERHIFDIGVAAKVRALVSELSGSDTVTIFLENI